jgi:hypothetical protein
MTHPITGANALPDRPEWPDALLAGLTGEQGKLCGTATGRCCGSRARGPVRPRP